jgi:hypothetical protein
MKRYLLLAALLLMMVGLACGWSGELPVTIPTDAAATAAAVGEQAAVAAATAAALAAEQGAVALATLQASELPDLSNLPELDVLRERLADIRPDEAGVYTVIITEAEMSQALAAKAAADAAAGVTSNLQNPAVRLTGGQLIFSADVQQPVAARLTISFRAYVVNGALQFEVTQASLGNVQVPVILLQVAQGQLNSTLGAVLGGLPANLQLQEVVIGEGFMRIVASWR